jgi:tetratricopeptide (TPR) repeat protein
MCNTPCPPAQKPKKTFLNQAKLQELSNLLQQGLELHRANRLQEAHSCYQMILSSDPNHFDALQLSATIQYQTGNHAAAILIFDQALLINKTNAAVFNNRGNALNELKRFDDALASYEQALKIKPDYDDAFCNRGNTLQELKRFDDALASYEQALKIRPDHADAFNNRGNTLHELRRFDDALASYEQALKIRPDYADAFCNRGNTLQELKRFDDALASYEQALKIRPDYPQAFYNRGNTLRELKRFDDALASYEQALKIRPDYAEAFNNRANTLQELKRFDDALASYEQALKIKPDYADAFNNRGNTLQELKRFDDALASYEQALKIKPGYADAFNNRGNTLHELRRFDDALASYEQALKIKPDYAEALYNQGNTLHELKRFDDALASHEQALKIKPDYAEAFYNRGNTLHELKRFDDALASYEQALKINPDYVDAHWNSSLLHLLLGNFSDGWMLYEWRLKKEDTRHNYYSGQEVSWRGKEDIAGKRLLIHFEQGLGDSIQFARYLYKVVELGAYVIFQVQRPLLSIFASMNLPVTLIAYGDPLPAFDAYCPLMSLPSVFKTSLDTIPAAIPYLIADQGKVEKRKQQFGPSDQIRVGLVWSGSVSDKNDTKRNRSISLDKMLPLLDLPIEFHSLQKEYRKDDLAILDRDPRIHRHEDELNDFDDTAALIETLDLVISIDTSVAHLAGAMGKQVWVLVPYLPDFRWLLDRKDSPWYPTLRLFRQDERREWRSVLNEVKTALKKLR